MKVRCPNCKNTMIYFPKGKPKNKTCVYCGKSFKVYKNINDHQIVKK